MDITAAVREMNELADTLDHAMSSGAVVDPADLDRLAELIVSATSGSAVADSRRTARRV